CRGTCASRQAKDGGSASRKPSWQLARTGGGFSLPIRKAVGSAGKNLGEQPIHTGPRMALVLRSRVVTSRSERAGYGTPDGYIPRVGMQQMYDDERMFQHV